jgi:hypothetical protein
MAEPDFDPSKFNELIVYLATRLGPEAALGRVKLAKLLMQSDFGAYERRGVSITGDVRKVGARTSPTATAARSA